ncbi:unnamed protein product [Hymenolepis diminuta]|uniref:Uncharacterized protein n=1 Tax=Hymenolepis diminuta TaxID=6216 RepID=A0A564Y233_HYMDI|nr:unnamed protein product [Hymenolepis diminuta]
MSIVSAVLLVLFICASAHGQEKCSNESCFQFPCCEGYYCDRFENCRYCRTKNAACILSKQCCSKSCNAYYTCD